MKKQLDTRRIRVSHLLPKREHFEKLGFKLIEIDNAYEIIELPSDWKIRKIPHDDYFIFDNKKRIRGRIHYSKHNLPKTYIFLFSIVSIGVGTDGDENSYYILIDDSLHKISNESCIIFARFQLPKFEFDNSMSDFFTLYDIFISKNICENDIVVSEFETKLPKEEIMRSFQQADDFLKEKFPNWKDPTLYWD